MTGKIIIGTRVRDLSNIWSTSSAGAYLTNQSNNVGIGNTNPQYTLDITGDISVNCLEVISYPNSANYNNWTKNSNVISTTNNVGINKSSPSVELDVSGNINISGTAQISAIQNIGRQVVADISSIDSLTHNGNVNIYGATLSGTSTDSLTEVSGNIIASKYLVVNSDTSEPDDYLDGDAEIYGSMFINGGIGYSSSSPFIFRVRDLVATDATNMGVDVHNTFLYIDRTGNLVANGNTSESLGNTSFKRRILQLPAGVDEEIVKVYKNRLQTSVITSTGKVFSMGYNFRVSCGIFNNNTERITVLTRAFTMDSNNIDISNLVFTKIIMSAANPQFTYALTNTGRLYSCGVNSYGQLADGTNVSTQLKTSPFSKAPGYVNVGNQNRTVVDVRTAGSLSGTNYTGSVCVLDASSLVWCAGYGGNGANGQGIPLNDVYTLTTVKVSAGVDLSNVTSIYDYGYDEYYGFFAINAIGELFVWGFNNAVTRFNGGTTTAISFATKINSNVGTSNPITKVWTDRTINYGGVFVVDSVGNVYGTGRGYALGVGRTVDLSGWRVIPHFNSTTKRLVEMYPLQGVTSDADTAVFAITRNTTTDVYTLWATGDNTAGSLGLGNTTDTTVWSNVGLHSDIVRRITKIIGWGHDSSLTQYTTILLDNGCVLVAGRNLPLYNETGTIDNRFRLL